MLKEQEASVSELRTLPILKMTFLTERTSTCCEGFLGFYYFFLVLDTEHAFTHDFWNPCRGYSVLKFMFCTWIFPLFMLSLL